MSYSPDDGCDYSDYARRPSRSPHACRDRMCGAADCSTCRPGTWDDEDDEDDEKDGPPDTALTGRMIAAGYTYDGPEDGWSKVASRLVRHARKDHKRGNVKAGEYYHEDIVRTVTMDGTKYQHRVTRPLSPAELVAHLRKRAAA